MNFEEYAKKCDVHKFLKEYKQREHAWNAALDEAAKVAAEWRSKRNTEVMSYDAHESIVEAIKALKDE